MIKGWKTALFGLLLTIFGALEAYDFTQLLDADNAGIAASVVGVIVLILRALTSTPMGKSE